MSTLDHREALARRRSTSVRAAVRALLLAAVVSALPAIAFAGGGPATRLVNVADTRDLEPGFIRWIGDVYNDNLLLFGLLVVVIMAAMGGGLGFVFDRGVAMIGINLGKLDHHE